MGRQSGVVHASLVVLVIVLGAVGASGYYIYQKNKAIDEPVVIQAGTQPKKATSQSVDTSSTTTVNTSIDFLKVKVLLPEGWSVASSDNEYGTEAVISHPDKDLTIVATSSTRPVGFSGTCEGHGVDSGARTFVNTPTKITDISVLGLERTDGVSTTGYSMELVSQNSKLFRSVDTGKGFDAADATDVSVRDLQAGATYYYCSPLTPPFYWTASLDYIESNQDGIYVSNKTQTDIRTSMVLMSGYDDVLSILKSVVR